MEDLETPAKQLPRSRVSEEVGSSVRKPELQIVPGNDEKIEPASLEAFFQTWASEVWFRV